MVRTVAIPRHDRYLGLFVASATVDVSPRKSNNQLPLGSTSCDAVSVC